MNWLPKRLLCRYAPLLAAFFSFYLVLPAAETNDASVERMKKDIFFLAGDECEGRGIETQGINKAADHIASLFKEIGLKPGMPDGTYFQPFQVSGSPKLSAPNNLTLRSPSGETIEPKINSEWTVSGLTGKGKAANGVVFAGYGITQKDGYDDYKDIDAKGKIVIILRQTPRHDVEAPKKSKKDGKDSKEAKEPGETLTPFPNAMRFAPLTEKISNAEAHKAAGILFISDRKTAGDDDSLMPFEYARGAGAASMPVMHIKRALADQMLASQGKKLAEIEKVIDVDLKPRSIDLKGWTAAMETTVQRVEYKVKNIIGILEGKGPLANETVVIGAHYDHLGRGEVGSRSKGSKAVHFGADDNGSGSTAVMELARRFAAMKDREGRRIVFMTFSGEERGLLGSVYYCKNPIIPLKETVAMVNLDMVGRLRDDAQLKKGNLEVGGLGSAKSFESMVDGFNKKYDFHIKKSMSGTGPSDHTSFYLKQIPVLFFFTGMHKEYHTPEDKPETINLEGMKKVVDMIEEIALKLATDKEKPQYVASKNDATTTSARGIPSIRFMPGDYDDDQSNGVLVGGVAPGGPAEKGGLKEGDWIVAVGGKPVKNMAGYMKVMGEHKAGETIDFTVKRGDKQVPLKITALPMAAPKAKD